MNKATFNLCPGIWSWWIRDKNTLDELTPVGMIMISKKIDWTFNVPDELKDNKDAEIIVKRVR